METLIFVLMAAVSIAAALGLLMSKNAVYAALFLVLNFGTVAVFYLLLNAPFLAVVQLSVYAGAIMVLFLFVIMLLGAERLQTEDTHGSQWQRPLAAGLGITLVVLSAIVMLGGTAPVQAAGPLVDSSPLAIGQQLFGAYLFPFEVVSILLLVAMIGAVVLTRDK